MENTETWRVTSIKRKATAILLAVLLVLMLATNPGDNGFIKFLQEYVRTESGATLEPAKDVMAPPFTKSNYYLFSTYKVRISGVDHEFLGAFGSFHNY